MGRPLRIYIFVEGGNVQSVATRDGDDVEYVVVDYDIDGADEADITPVKQSDGSIANAHVYGPYDADTMAVEIA